MLITSATNAHIKNIISLKEKSKVRKSTGLFTVEGIKMFLEVPRDELKEIYVSESFEKENKDKWQLYCGIRPVAGSGKFGNNCENR